MGGDRFLESIRAEGAAPDLGLCVAGTMAEFGSLSVAAQRLHLEAHPQQVGRVDRVALVQGALLATIQHWPTATKVAGVPLTRMRARPHAGYSALDPHGQGDHGRAGAAGIALARGPVDVRAGRGGLVPPGDPPQGGATTSSSSRDQSWATSGGAPRSSYEGTS